jgi:hypothetical protein
VAVNLNKDTVYSAGKPKEKDYTISGGGGLFLFIPKSCKQALVKS